MTECSVPDPKDHIQARITRYWNVRAVSYEGNASSRIATGPARDAWVGVWRGALPDPPADVLDVGTGPGPVALLLAELDYRVTGIDLAEGMLDLARAKSARMANPPTFQTGDAVTPPFLPASFDAVASRYLLWTLREPQLALTHWRRLLRPGGVLAAVDGTWYANGPPRHHDNPCVEEYRRVYNDQVMASLPLCQARTIDRAADLVRAAGFADVGVTQLPELERLRPDRLADPADVPALFLITARTG